MQTQLAGLGRRPDLNDELAELAGDSLTPARVVAQHRGRWLVAAPISPGDQPGEQPPGDWQTELVSARTRAIDRAEGPPVTGDWVVLDAGGAIAYVLERRGAIVRQDVDGRSRAQPLAANVDVALVVEAFPQPNLRRAERMLALATAGDVRPLLVLTKADLAPAAEVEAARVARELGLLEAYPLGLTERAGEPALSGLLPLTRELEPDTTAVLLGVSGAGKSTLANALLGRERQATQAVRARDGRGRHTTVARELFALPGGALLIDGPGIRRVNVWDGAGTVFADIDELAGNCRFGDCRHESEPGCAVRDTVAPERLAAWRKLEREQAWIDDRRAAERERERRGRSHSRTQRVARRIKGDD
ncbi:MAG TPA: ribosome small subunit-dependent GTPase A [Thermoleophilaceae bacterium]